MRNLLLAPVLLAVCGCPFLHGDPPVDPPPPRTLNEVYEVCRPYLREQMRKNGISIEQGERLLDFAIILLIANPEGYTEAEALAMATDDCDRGAGCTCGAAVVVYAYGQIR